MLNVIGTIEKNKAEQEGGEVMPRGMHLYVCVCGHEREREREVL